MKLTDEQLCNIEEMGAALMAPREIALLLGLDFAAQTCFVEICKSHAQSPVYHAYHRGVLQTKYDLRKNIIKLAKNGSPAAEPIAERFLKEHSL